MKKNSSTILSAFIPIRFSRPIPLQAERLYSLIFEILNPQKDDCLLDLYCGAGAIGICASGLVSRVIGVELEPAAIRAASENAALNGIKNITFHTASVQDILLHDSALLNDASCAIIDPPRAGLHPKALKKIAQLSLPRLIYVSCNPGTFARDASYLVQEGYKITRIAPVDMFPHTMHIELVAGFIK